MSPVEERAHEDVASTGTSGVGGLPLAQAITYLQNTIEKLSISLNRIDDIHDLRYRNLQLELQNVSAKLDTKASQLSVDELHRRVGQQSEEVRGDIKTIKTSVDLVLDLLKRSPD